MKIHQWALAAAVLAASLLAQPASAEDGPAPCSVPVLTGPRTVTAGDSYAVSWTNVLAKTVASASDTYELQRASDPEFTNILDRVKTTRPSQTLGPAPAGLTSVSHRVLVSSAACPVASPAALASNVFTTSINPDCQTPETAGGLAVNPRSPPAFSTYVVSWDATGSQHSGPGGGTYGLRFRLRRTTAAGVKDSVFTNGSASFQDVPGTYYYEVRAEAPCGAVGEWSDRIGVIVGAEPAPALTLVADPSPLVGVAGGGMTLYTSLSVRNGGTEPLAVTSTAEGPLSVSPGTATLAAGETRVFSVATTPPPTSVSPVHGAAVLSSNAGRLRIPIDATLAAAAADAAVVWSDADAEVPDDGSPVVRTLLNLGGLPAAIVGSVGASWIHVDVDGSDAWDRPLAPGEKRVVRIAVDRSARRAPYGTETGVVSVTTAGFPGVPARLLVIDDGPVPSVSTGLRPAFQGAKTRLLYASMPNAKDALGVGRFATDLWLTNLDASAPIDVTVWATPFAPQGATTVSASMPLTLAPGETRRYRNIMRRLFTYDGSCEVEVRSPASTLSATAVVANTPEAAPGTIRGVMRADGTVVNAEPVTPGQYGFEMRPTAPGEGVKATDPTFVLSGLAHDARRRTNLILTETSGVQTSVLVVMFDWQGNPVVKNGETVELSIKVPPLASVQINDADLFAADMAPAPYALVYFQSGDTDPVTGLVTGSVVPFATVIDAGTEDASLRVGASLRSLSPLTQPSVASRPRSLAGTSLALPFGGGPAPLLFPAAHLRGATLADGSIPSWKTRVSFTNVNENQTRQFTVRFLNQTGSAPDFQGFVILSPKSTFSSDDFSTRFFASDTPAYGAMVIEPLQRGDGTFEDTWQDVDVQTETYTPDPKSPALGDYKTGMEGFSYRHGYSSFQSNLGTAQIEGAESSSRFRTNLILQEVGGAACTVAVSAYVSGSFVPIATANVALPAFGYVSKELFAGILGLDRKELVDVRIVVRQLDGDGVFMAFVSKINLTTGDPANIFLRPASAGTGR